MSPARRRRRRAEYRGECDQVLRRCGRGGSVLALVIRYERGGEAAGDRGPGPVSQSPGEIFSRGKYEGARQREGRARPGENGQVMMADVCGLAGPRAQSSRMWSAGLRAVTWHHHHCLVAGSARAAAVDSKCISGACSQVFLFRQCPHPLLVTMVPALAAGRHQPPSRSPQSSLSWAGPGPALCCWDAVAGGLGACQDCSQPRQDRGTLTGRCSGFYIYMLLWWSQNPRLQRIPTQTRLICSEVSILGRQQPAASKPSTEPTPNTPQNQIYNS